MADLTTKLEIARALVTIETLGRELSADDAYELYRHIGTRQAVIRQRLSREGMFQKPVASAPHGSVLSAVTAKAG